MSDGSDTDKIPRLLSIKDVAQATTLPRSTIYDLVAAGELPAIRIGESRGIRIAEHDLERFLESRRQLRAQPAQARAIRQQAGLTQAEIAECLNVDPSVVSRYEAGRRVPTRKVMGRYAAILEALGDSS